MIDIFLNFNPVLLIELIIAGFLIGIIASMVGIGGGLIMVPTLILIFDRSAQLASAISIVVIIFTSSSASLANYNHKRIDIRTGLFFALCVIPFSFIGSWTAEQVNDKFLVIIFGLLLLIVAVDRIRKLIIQLINKQNNKKPNQNVEPEISKEKQQTESMGFIPQSVESRSLIDSDGQAFNYKIKLRQGLIGAAIGGFLGGLLGLGGGLIYVPVLLAVGVPPHIAVATSSFIIIFTALSGSLGRILYGQVLWNYVIPLAIGAVIGARFGALKVRKISSQKVLILFYIILFLSGARMILKALKLFV